MKVSLKDTRASDHIDFKASFYLEKSDGKALNALLVDCKKRHYRARLNGATRIYLVLEGSGTFTINDETAVAELYDLFVVESGDAYAYKGEMRLFECNVPATDSANEDQLE